MKIKICGITQVEDAKICLDNGADMIGLNFHPPSPRYLTLDKATRLIGDFGSERSGIKLIGVFVNTSVEEIHKTAVACELDAVQLHGDETVKDFDRLRSLGLNVFKGFRGSPTNQQFESFLDERQNPILPDALIDAYHPGLFGGTGEVMKSDQIGTFLELMLAYPNKRFMLAGGLKPENVSRLIKITQPWGVDTASGVELSPGIKDHRKIVEFCRAARS